MNKGELIDAVAASTGLSKADAGRAIDATTSAIAGELASGGSCALVGFGTFSVSHRAARAGRNPATVKQSKLKQAMCLNLRQVKLLRMLVTKNKHHVFKGAAKPLFFILI